MALGMGRRLPSPSDIITLCSIARLQSQGGDKLGADQTIEFAAELANKIIQIMIPRMNFGSLALTSVAVAQGLLLSRDIADTTFKAALTAASKINYDTEKYEAYQGIAIGQAEAGLVEEAFHTLGLIGKVDPGETARRGIALAQAEAGDYDGAFATAGELRETWDRIATIFDASIMWAQKGNSVQARRRIARALIDEEEPSSHSETVGLARAAAFALSKANAFSEVSRIADREEVFYERDDIFDQMLGEQVKAGDLDGALSTLNEIGLPLVAGGLVLVATRYEQNGDLQQALILLDKAVLATESIGNSYYRVKTLCQIAGGQARNGAREKAKETIASAHKAVEELAMDTYIQAALAQVAAAESQVVGLAEGKATFERAKGLLSSHRNEPIRYGISQSEYDPFVDTIISLRKSSD
jgi:tetratricopeptide (TPR) repeat protein